jgi:hypothetical protein
VTLSDVAGAGQWTVVVQVIAPAIDRGDGAAFAVFHVWDGTVPAAPLFGLVVVHGFVKPGLIKGCLSTGITIRESNQILIG